MAENIFRILVEEIGENKVFDSEEHRLTYAADESGIGTKYLPDYVVHPESTEDVVKVLEIAQKYRIPVVPRGSGTGVAGGAVALHGGIMVVLDRMKRIREIDRENLYVVVEPGVITGELDKEVRKEGLFYPPDPASIDSCTIGGNIATNAGGPRALKYGVTKHYVLEIEVVTPGGRVFRFGRKTKKWVVGYDLVSLFVGSEGTLGIITEATLRLIPDPPQVETILVAFPDEVAASETVTDLIKKRFLPRALEFMDRVSVYHIKSQLPGRLPDGTNSLLLIEIDGRGDLFQELEDIAVVCEEHGALEIFASRDDRDRERMWQARRSVFPTLEEKFEKVRSEDITVPRNLIPEAVRRIRKMASKLGMEVATFGHAGDGNLHVNFLYTSDKEKEMLRGVEELYRIALDLGGTISGEHGVGILKKPFLHMEQPPELIALQKGLKKYFDPEGVMNPGKVFP